MPKSLEDQFSEGLDEYYRAVQDTLPQQQQRLDTILPDMPGYRPMVRLLENIEQARGQSSIVSPNDRPTMADVCHAIWEVPDASFPEQAAALEREMLAICNGNPLLAQCAFNIGGTFAKCRSWMNELFLDYILPDFQKLEPVITNEKTSDVKLHELAYYVGPEANTSQNEGAVRYRILLMRHGMSQWSTEGQPDRNASPEVKGWHVRTGSALSNHNTSVGESLARRVIEQSVPQHENLVTEKGGNVVYGFSSGSHNTAFNLGRALPNYAEHGIEFAIQSKPSPIARAQSYGSSTAEMRHDTAGLYANLDFNTTRNDRNVRLDPTAMFFTFPCSDWVNGSRAMHCASVADGLLQLPTAVPEGCHDVFNSGHSTMMANLLHMERLANHTRKVSASDFQRFARASKKDPRGKTQLATSYIEVEVDPANKTVYMTPFSPFINPVAAP